jgi:hypothetical protein
MESLPAAARFGLLQGGAGRISSASARAFSALSSTRVSSLALPSSAIAKAPELPVKPQPTIPVFIHPAFLAGLF